ncbi:MAG: trans-2-enoyl-CoA reductase family protein [Verrucomicrobiales bacterium]|nr:trans-2-enoyl-CoA reductase family protein [Verrucomicrobiales bacterium]
MIVTPKIRGFICTTAHPDGCAQHVQEQIGVVNGRGPIANGPKKVLVIGSSTGYGLASRIAAAFGCRAATVGVFFERPGDADRTATAGWYNSAAFEKEAAAAGLYARSFNGDAFSDALKTEVIAAIRADLAQVDCVIYSLASPRRTHPRTGETYKSVLKPIGTTYTNKNLNTGNGVVNEVTIEPAEEEEVTHTVAVMGGEDWEMWMDALQAAGALAPGVQTVAYSYIGPELTWPIYKNGTIGRAKEDLERVQRALDAKLRPLGGKAWVSVNKALVTQASSAIPVVPLYISLLYRIMKDAGTHEDCIEQMDRLFRDRLAVGNPQPDEAGRIRLDDWEMAAPVQQLIAERWAAVTTDNLSDLADFSGYQESFLRLFGFGLPGVDYAAGTDPTAWVPSIPKEAAGA